MSRRLYLVLCIAIAGIQPALASVDQETPYDFFNNRYLLESRRLAELAEETFSEANFIASEAYAQGAIHHALLSDVYIAITLARFRLEQLDSSGVSQQYPNEYAEAQTWYNASLSAWDQEEWDEAIDAAHMAVAILAHIEVPDAIAPLPATYMVRSWHLYRDCFWNIAALPWVYGDPFQWRVLYNANRSKLPDPNNPDLILPDMLMEIPSIRGEIRQGEWDESRTYDSLN